MSDSTLADTAVLPSAVPTENKRTTDSSSVDVDLYGMSDMGKVRGNNEDTFLIARFQRSMETLATNLPAENYQAVCTETGFGLLIADGMGGHAAGEVASQTAVRVLLDHVLQTPDWIMRWDDELIEEMFRRTRQRVQSIQQELNQHAQVDATLAGMGTTLTLAWSAGRDLLLAHVGDSRAYLLREGGLRQLTKDQTMAQFLVDVGAISEKEAETHKARHVLTGVLTTGTTSIPLEFHRFRLSDGDQLLLCSDGLTDMVTESSIVNTLNQAGCARDACQTLINQALEAGGRDNVTVAIARYRIPTSTSAS